MPTLDEMRLKAIDDLASLSVEGYDTLSEDEKSNQRSVVARKLRSVYDLHKHISADLVCQHMLGKQSSEVSQDVFNVCYDASIVIERVAEHERYH